MTGVRQAQTIFDINSVAHKKRKGPTMESSLGAGAIAGLSACLLLQPLDLVKTRLQEPTDLKSSRRIPSIIRDVIRQHGITGLWRGTLPTMARNVPGSALYFATLHQLRYWALVSGIGRSSSKDGGRLTTAADLIAGALARSIVGLMMMPVTVVKVRYESHLYEYKGLRSAIGEIAAKEGLAGFFRGWGTTLLRDAPYAGIYLAIYGHLRQTDSPVHWKLAAGLLAGSTACLLTHPFDLVRVRIQLRPDEYRNGWRALRRIQRADLVRGLVPRILRKSLNSAITWVIYEQIMHSA